MIESIRIVLCFVVLVVLAAGCKEQQLPDFVHEVIDWHVESDIRAIWSFRYNGDTVYYVQSGCCDMYNELYNVQGERICAPDGGFTGAGDGICPDFWDSAKRRIVIWERGQQTF